MRPDRLTAVLLAAVLALGPLPLRGQDKLSLEDIGYTREEARGDPGMQALLEKRASMLKTHQALGLATAVPLAATFFSGEGAGGKRSDRNLHAALGLGAAAMYFVTASFAIRAPEAEGSPEKGMTGVHRALAFVHFPAMLLVPVSGLAAKRQRDRGQSLHGIAKYHSTIAGTAAGAFLGAMAVMTIKF